jgi:UDP-glucose 4-epimerase
MRILVTGGAGYVGSHCVRALCDAGHDVVVLDSLVKGHRGAVDARASLVVADLGDRGRLNEVLGGETFDGVMHFAAFAEVGESVKDPLSYYQNNVVKSAVLLDAMREHSVRRIVFSSTCAVYGVPPSAPITEDMPRSPISPYGRTKLAMEWMLSDCANAWGLGAIALRYFNASGASASGAIGEDHDPESHLIPLVLQVALGQREKIMIFGDDYETPDGTCVRDYVHVDDLAAIHKTAIEKVTAGAFAAYNVGTGQGTSVKAVIDASRSVTGHQIPTEVVDRRAGDPPALFADPALISCELGWSPKYSEIEATIESAWNWHRSHPRGFAE